MACTLDGTMLEVLNERGEGEEEQNPEDDP